MVVMGQVTDPYGVKGWVKVRPATEVLDTLLAYSAWWLKTELGWHEYVVQEAKVHGNHLLAKLAGVADRDEAFQLKGKLIAVPRERLPALGQDEYYWSDLIGVEVRNTRDVMLGCIDHLFKTSANDVMVVQGERERLIPFISQVVLDVDLAKRRMTVDWDAEF